MSGVDRGPQRPGEHEGTTAGLYVQQPQPQMASINKPQWPGGTPHVVSASFREKPLQQQQQQQDLKQREYLKQQQRLKAMGVPNKKNVSADALIGNLLEKKDTFRPQFRAVHSSATSLGIPSPTPVERSPTEQRALNEELPSWIWPCSPRLPPVYSHIWTLVVDPTSVGTLVDTNRIFPLLLTSGLPTQVLGFIWNLAAQGVQVPGHVECVQGGSGQLTQQQLYVVLALVALAQTGCTFNSLSILKMLPQPPLPMFNMGAKSTSTEGGHHINAPVVPVPVVPGSSTVVVPATVIPTPVAQPVAVLPIAVTQQQPPAQDPFFSSDSKEDDFTEFQSADIPSATVVQPSSAAKQVVNELNHSVIARLGNQGRSIGSRLANHTLGAPKTSRSHHHKHHRSERRASMETPYFDDEVTFGGGRSRKLSSDNSIAAKADEPYLRNQQGGDFLEYDDFSDFQVAIGLNINVDELFPKCKQIKKRTVLLKESAIRNEPDEKEEKQPETEMLALDAVLSESKVSPHLQPPPPPPQKVHCQTMRIISEPASAASIQPPKLIEPTSQTPIPADQTDGKELMAVQEDKYSALRFLEIESTTANPSDDFGDFVSAQDSFADIAEGKVSADNSFAEIAQRKTSDPGPSLFAANSDVEVPVEDSFLQIAERGTDTGKSLFAESEPSQAKVEETEMVKFPVDDWLSFESTPVTTENTRPAVEDLSSIFSSVNVSLEAKTLQPQIEVTRDDDEFGDFVGPEDDNSGKLAATMLSDNRSVSSFEMTNASLSRHGSLPSLDLKIFPQGDDSLDKFKEGCVPINEWQRCLDCCVDSLDKFKEGCVPINEWQRCLDCCVSLLQSAVNTFTSISSQVVVLEVLSTSEGRAYFINLKEVRNVCNRICYSYLRCGQELNQINTLLKTAQQAWDSLERFYKLAHIDTVDIAIREENGSAVPCCICCCSTSAEALEYNGHTYHSSCANLWLNCVSST